MLNETQPATSPPRTFGRVLFGGDDVHRRIDAVSNGSDEKQPLRVVAEPGGIVHVDVATRVVNRDVATAMCGAITQEAARDAGAPRLLMNLGSLSRATPGAGLYAMRQIKKLDPQAIAFYGGGAFMRMFARAVLRLARFRLYALFADEEAARAWLTQSAG